MTVTQDALPSSQRLTAAPSVSGTREAASPRLLQLDILRGVAILLVINFHAVLSSSQAGFLSPVVEPLRRIGWTGVDLFFVLSGFLIGGLLFKEWQTSGGLDAPRFLIRRAFKIWPSYYLYIAFVGVALYTTDWMYKEVGSNSILPNLLHIQNYTIPPRNHTWSLAVEEHFYLALPFVLVLLMRRRDGRGMDALPWIALSVAILCLTLRFLMSFRQPFGLSTHFTPTHLRIDSLFFGVFLAYLFHCRPEIWERWTRRRWALFAVGVALILPAAFIDFHRRVIAVPGFTALYLGYGAMLMAIMATPLGVGIGGKLLLTLPARALAFIGVHSYPIYLWHVDCGQMPLRYLAGRGFLAELPDALRWTALMLIYVAIATLVGVLMGKLAEKPALALRDRLFPSRVASLAAERSHR